MELTDPAPLICPFCGSSDTLQFADKVLCIACNREFDPAQGRKAPPGLGPAHASLTFFLSCADPENPVCRGIKEALEKRGHTVWTDTWKNHADPEWRRSLAERLERSQGVVSCLTRRAVRDPCVCLDELAVALGIPGLNIVTLHLEPERLVDPPASLCAIQYLDATEGLPFQEKDRETFELWLKGVYDLLYRALEDPRHMKVSGNISELQETLSVSCQSPQLSDLLGQPFFGRQWLTAQVLTWLDRPKGPRLCALSGDPGAGASAFAAHMAHYSGRVAGALFLESPEARFTDSRALLRTLACLVACRVPDYRQILLSLVIDDRRLGDLGETELFQRLFAAPMKRLKGQNARKPQCVILDGLDECDPEERAVVLHVLKDYLLRLPSWLRVLVITRDPASLQIPPKTILSLRLRAEDNRNRKDIQAFFASVTGPRSDPKAAALLAERSGGNFLCARMLADGILSGNLSVQSPAAIPVGLARTFPAWMSWCFPDSGEYLAVWRPAVNMLLASPEPLPREELSRVLDWDESLENEFLLRIRSQIRRGISDFEKETVEFRHPSLSRWLQDQSAAGPYSASAEEGIAAMAESFYRLWKTGPDTFTGYEALHLVEFLEESGNMDRVREICLDGNLILKLEDFVKTSYFSRIRNPREACLQLMVRLGQNMAQERGTEEDKEELVLACFHYAGVLQKKSQPKAALAYYERCRDLGEELVRDGGNEATWTNLAESHRGIAAVLRLQGESEKALEFLETARSIQEQLLERIPSADMRSRLIGTCIACADLLRTLDRPDEAMECCRKAEALREEIFRADPSPENECELLDCRRLIAELRSAQGNPDEAMELFQEARTRANCLVDDHRAPENLRLMQKLCASMGDILLEQDRPAEALELALEEEAVSVLLAGSMPDAENHDSYASCLERKGKAQLALGKPDEALYTFQGMANILETQVKALPSLKYRRRLAIGLSTIANTLTLLNRITDALSFYRRAIDLQGDIFQEDPNPASREQLVLVCNEYGQVLQMTEQHSAALNVYQNILPLWKQVAQETPTQENTRYLAMCHLSISLLLSIRNKPSDAFPHAKASQEIMEELVRRNPTEDNRSFLSRSYEALGDVAAFQGKIQDALGHYRKACSLAEELVSEDPSNRHRELYEEIRARIRGFTS